jgi:hypothetical protein
MPNGQLKMPNVGILSELKIDNTLHLTFGFSPLALFTLTDIDADCLI